MSKYINRTMENLLNELIDRYPVITITGPRQVGKSTLLEYIIKNNKKEITYVTLDDMFLRASANEDPLLFLKNYNTPLIIPIFDTSRPQSKVEPCFFYIFTCVVSRSVL